MAQIRAINELENSSFNDSSFLFLKMCHENACPNLQFIAGGRPHYYDTFFGLESTRVDPALTWHF